MTRKLMMILVVVCVAMAAVGVTFTLVISKQGEASAPKFDTPKKDDQSLTVNEVGIRRYSVELALNPTEAKTYDITLSDDLDASVSFAEEGDGKLKDVVYVTVSSAAETKINRVLLRDVFGKEVKFDKGCGKITVTFTFPSGDDDNAYQGAVADFTMQITARRAEQK